MSEMLDHPIVRHRIDSSLLLTGRCSELEVTGFKLSDVACLLLNYMEQATNDELEQLLQESKGVTNTNCWCMSFGAAPSVTYLAESVLQDRGRVNQPPTPPHDKP